MDIQGEINKNTVILRDFNTSLTSVDRSSRQKINKETVALNSTRSNGCNWYLQNISHHSSRIYILFRWTWNVSRIDHMLGHKTSLNKFKKIEIISSTFSDHNAMKLEINHKTTENIHKDMEAK